MKNPAPIPMRFSAELKKRIRESSEKIGMSPQQTIQWAVAQGVSELLHVITHKKKTIDEQN